jgi:hypothetical protein
MKTKLSTITAAMATIAVIAIMGTLGGIGQQQTALALELDLGRLLDDEIELDDEINEELGDLIQRGGHDIAKSVINNLRA